MLLCGAPCSGKSSLFGAFNSENFIAEYSPTNKTNFMIFESNTVQSFKMQIWDVNFALVGRSFFKGTNGIILVVDVTDVQVEELQRIYYDVKDLIGLKDYDTIPCFILATKCDQLEQYSDSHPNIQRLMSWVESLQRPAAMPVFLVSAVERSAVRIDTVRAWSAEYCQENRFALRSVLEYFMDNIGSYWAMAATVSSRSPPWPTLALAPASSPPLPVPQSPASTGSPATSIITSTSASASIDRPLKVTICGACGVGKTAIIHSFVFGSPTAPGSDGSYCPTIGADLRVAFITLESSRLILQPEKPVRLSNKRRLRLHLWDTSGRAETLPIGRTIFRGSNCLMLVYDISSRESFDALDLYYNNYIAFAQIDAAAEFPCLLVGNKNDLQRAVCMEEVLSWCTIKRPRRPITYVECSVTHNIAIHDIFLLLTESVLEATSQMEGLSDSDSSSSESSEDEDEDCSVISRDYSPPAHSGGAHVAAGGFRGLPRVPPRTPTGEETCLCLWGLPSE